MFLSSVKSQFLRLGHCLLPLARSPAVYYENQVVGHVPYNLAPTVSAFLRSLRCKQRLCTEVTGDKVNRGAGYGLEIPCTYRLYGPKPYVDWMKDIVGNWRSAGCVF